LNFNFPQFSLLISHAFLAFNCIGGPPRKFRYAGYLVMSHKGLADRLRFTDRFPIPTSYSSKVLPWHRLLVRVSGESRVGSFPVLGLDPNRDSGYSEGKPPLISLLSPVILSCPFTRTEKQPKID
jgi:hypothetical protein